MGGFFLAVKSGLDIGAVMEFLGTSPEYIEKVWFPLNFLELESLFSVHLGLQATAKLFRYHRATVTLLLNALFRHIVPGSTDFGFPWFPFYFTVSLLCLIFKSAILTWGPQKNIHTRDFLKEFHNRRAPHHAYLCFSGEKFRMGQSGFGICLLQSGHACKVRTLENVLLSVLQNK